MKKQTLFLAGETDPAPISRKAARNILEAYANLLDPKTKMRLQGAKRRGWVNNY